MYTVKPLVKAGISRISTHLLKSFPLSTTLRKKEERKKKKKEKGMKIQEVCFLRYDEHPRHFYRRVSGPGRM